VLQKTIAPIHSQNLSHPLLISLGAMSMHAANFSTAAHAMSVDVIINTAIASHRKLLHFMRRFERDPTLVEDLAQDVFVEVIKSVSRYEGRSSPETWIFGVAANVGRSHRASMTRRRVQGREVHMEDEDIELQHVDAGFLENLIATERLGQIQAAVDEMPSALRHTFESLYVCDLSYQQTADLLGVPIGTIRSRASRLRELLGSL
jgi:RNA polymerase sigma-70 factor (ECF subfamily)